MNQFILVFSTAITGISLGFGLCYKEGKTFLQTKKELKTNQMIQPIILHTKWEETRVRSDKNVSNMDKLAAVVEKLLKENTRMKAQQKLMNNDLHSLQFRVDSHSESFRPLTDSQELREIDLLPAP